MTPEFALINGGNRDELILSIACIFEHNKKGEATYPDQIVQIDKDNVRLLAAGKAYRCKVSIGEYFSSDFAKQGRKDDQMGGYYVFQMTVQIEWSDMDGNIHRKSVLHSDFGFDETGVIRLCKPLAQRVDLYAKSPPLKVVPIEAPSN